MRAKSVSGPHAQPQIGVVTNVGYAHIESFESIEGIAAAKRELIECLPQASTAVLNADDPRVLRFSEYAKDRSSPTELRNMRTFAPRTWSLRSGSSDIHRAAASRFRTSLTGRHVVSNILAGLAVACVFGHPFRTTWWSQLPT